MFSLKIKIKFSVFIIFCFALSSIAVSIPSDLQSQLKVAKPGQIIDFNVVDINKEIMLNSTNSELLNTGSPLFYSNAPAVVTNYGILYQTTLSPNNNRIYIYHINGTNEPVKIAAVVQDVSGKSNKLLFTKKSLIKPSKDFAEIDKKLIENYYNTNNLPSPIAFKPYQVELIDSGMKEMTVAPGELFAAIYECKPEDLLNVATLVHPVSVDSISFYNSIINKDDPYKDDSLIKKPDSPYVTGNVSGVSGSFLTSTRANLTPYTYEAQDGIKGFIIGTDGGDMNFDSPLQGSDQDTGKNVELVGNYGVTYEIVIFANNSDGSDVAVLLVPINGVYSGYMQIKISGDDKYHGQVLPADNGGISAKDKAVVCYIMKPQNNYQKLTLEFMNANSAKMPIYIMLVPLSH